MTDEPSPGSCEAIDAGCTCPVLDNAYGEGIAGNGERYWKSFDCPIHGVDNDD